MTSFTGACQKFRDTGIVYQGYPVIEYEGYYIPVLQLGVAFDHFVQDTYCVRWCFDATPFCWEHNPEEHSTSHLNCEMCLFNSFGPAIVPGATKRRREVFLDYARSWGFQLGSPQLVSVNFKCDLDVERVAE